MALYYRDYFDVRPDYAPCMTLADINKTPKTWLGFYPHESFVEILRELLKSLDGGKKTLWITGAYGTGKSHASLVLQKLFMDEEERVLEWLDLRKAQIPEPVSMKLLARRNEKVLIVYDVNSDNVDAKNQFLMRLQRGITKALKTGGHTIPLKGKLDEVIERIRQDGTHFFEKRDEMQAQLSHLHAGIKTAEALGQKLRDTNLESGLVSDAMQVLEARNIYMELTAEEFLVWANASLKENKISKLVYIWDEFSSFMDHNRTQLKTLEQLAEAAQQGQFYFIPVTHTEISSYVATGSESAKKANNRFTFKQLNLPNETALKLAADAFVVKPSKDSEWVKNRDELWHSVKGVVENYMIPNGASIDINDFKGILPIHPMAAFLLKHLSVVIGANQRSMFAFLNGAEFKVFLEKGGLDVFGHQFLTVDHLWAYFVERDDLGTEKPVQEIRSEYAQRNKDLQPEESRVLKTVLLFALVEQVQGEGNPLLCATVENIKRSFEGDGALTGVDTILQNLEKKHCFTIYNGRCERFKDRTDTKELEGKIKQLTDKFKDLVLGDTERELTQQLKMTLRSGRFDVRATDVNHLSPSSIKKSESFGEKGNRVLIQFILARNKEEQLRIPEKALSLAKQFKDHRMLFVTLPSAYFCLENSKAWDEFVENSARLALANDNSSKNVFETQVNSMKKAWHSIVTTTDKLTVYKPNPNGDLFVEELTWGQLKKDYLTNYAKQTFEMYTDDLSGYNHSALGLPIALKSWALAGIEFDNFTKSGMWKTVIKNWKKNGITGDLKWFDANPNHSLTHLKNKCKTWQDNTIGAGNTCSIRKLYIDLQRSPFGLLGVPHSAMVLGFVLKTWLTGLRKLQWTDGVTSKSLDSETLAEIIETVVKDNGENRIRNEKLICRLSREEKAFIDQSSVLFGSGSISDGTVETALNAITARLEQVTQRVPLWVLPEYIHKQAEPSAEMMKKVIDALCEVNSISSKGDAETRGNKVKEIGKILLATPGLSKAMANYMKPMVFAEAFQQYIDKTKPELKAVADRLGTSAHTYCNLVKTRFASTSGWLWKRNDADAVLEEIFRQMLCIEHISKLAGISGYISFEDALNRLHDAVLVENKVPTYYWARVQPAFQRLFELLERFSHSGDDMIVLEEILEQQEATLREIFFDLEQTRQLEAMSKIFGEIWPIAVIESRKLYNSFPAGSAKDDEQGFRIRGRSKIEEFNQSRISKLVEELWVNRTKTKSPHEWSRQYMLPAECILMAENARSLVDAVANPDAVSPERLKLVCTELEKENAFLNVDVARKKFLKRILPSRYQKLEIDIKKLSNWLNSELGNSPNRWMIDDRMNEAIESFIKQEYDLYTKDKALEKVNALSDAEAKKLLLKLIDKISDVGLSVLE